MNKTSFFFMRLPVAISLLGHGLVRLPKLAGFAAWMSSSMEKSLIPQPLVTVWGYLLPFIELLLGIWLLAGIQIRYSLYTGLTLMAILVLGSASVENWGAIEAQLIHAGYLLFLLWYLEQQDRRKPSDLNQ